MMIGLKQHEHILFYSIPHTDRFYLYNHKQNHHYHKNIDKLAWTRFFTGVLKQKQGTSPVT